MKIKTLFFTSILAAAAMSTVPAWAATKYTWNGGEFGTWDTKTDCWTPDTTGSGKTFVNKNTAVFKSNSDVSVTVSEKITASDIFIFSNSVTLTKSDKGSLTVSSAVIIYDDATLKYGAKDMIAGTIKMVSGGTLDLNGYSADSASIVGSKGGALKLSVNTDSAVNAKAVLFSEGAKLVLDLSNVSIASGTTLSILSSSDSEIQYIKNKTASALTASDADNLLAVGSSNLGKYADWKREWTVEKTTNGSTLKLTLTNSAVPEPSMFGLLAGVGALAFVAARRRRRAK